MHKPVFIAKKGQLNDRHGMPFRRAVGLEGDV
jgi:hypothetical protein